MPHSGKRGARVDPPATLQQNLPSGLIGTHCVAARRLLIDVMTVVTSPTEATFPAAQTAQVEAIDEAAS